MYRHMAVAAASECSKAHTLTVSSTATIVVARDCTFAVMLALFSYEVRLASIARFASEGLKASARAVVRACT